MFMKEMTQNGFFAVWVLCFVGYVLYLKGVLVAKKGNHATVNFDSFLGRVYGITGMNIITGLVIVVAPIVLYLTGLHWYWIITGVIVTLMIQTSYLTLMRVADRRIKEEVTQEERKRVKAMEIENIESEIGKRKTWFRLTILLNAGIYAVISLNAWDIIPLRAAFLPPVMPLYLHILLDWVQIGSIILGSMTTVMVVVSQMEYIHLLNIKTNNFNSKKGK